MNCQNFGEIVDAVAREQMMDAGARKEALSHAYACDSCALRLKDERALSSDLRQLALRMEDIGTPPVVEERLLLLFDARTASPANRRWAYSVTAIAAMLLLAFGFGMARRRVVVTPAPTPDTPVVKNIDAPTALEINQPGPGLSGKSPGSSSPRIRHRRPAANQGELLSDPANREIATDFIPVMYSATGAELGGQIVRVELPRSAMASFGLPVNMDRANQRVKADVLLGVDGLAHAIRFVQ